MVEMTPEVAAGADRRLRKSTMAGKLIIVILGPPGAGKGTQANRLSERLGLIHVSTGEILRAEVSRDSEIGKKVSKLMDAGELVPDDLMTEIVRRHIDSAEAHPGYILDGFPRNLTQAQYLEEALPDRDIFAFNLEVGEDQVVKRLTGRRYCPVCGRIYNVLFSPSRQGEHCEKCGAKLIQRPDDSKEVIAERLRVYREQTQPVIRFYAERSHLFSVDGDRDVESVASELASLTGKI